MNNGCFQKGNPPWNKGVYCRHSRRTEFKKGCLRGHAARLWTAIGSERIRNDHGNLTAFIKVRDDGPSQKRWVPRARVVWERVFGAVPPKHRIMHRNGESLDDRLENLICLTFAEAIAIQKQLNPNMEKKRSKRAAASARRRWQEYRALKEAEPKTFKLWLCAACGEEKASPSARCCKCGSSVTDEIERAA